MELNEKITTIRLKQETKDKLKVLKIYPCETDEEVLIRLIKTAIKEDD